MSNTGNLGERIADILDALGGQTGFAARRIGARPRDMADQRVGVRADAIFPAGDLARAPIAVEVMRRADLGQFGLDDSIVAAGAPQRDRETAQTVGDLCARMLAWNDDGAANALLDLVGMGEVNETLSRLKLERTRLRRPYDDEIAHSLSRDNVTCADDMVELLGLIAGRALPGSQRLLVMLSKEQPPLATSREDAPVGSRFLRCGGVGVDGSSQAGVLTGPGGSCVYCSLATQQTASLDVDHAIAEILRLLWDEWRLGPAV